MPAPPSASQGRHIRVRGLVQGVGFRPHVWRVAKAFGLSGEVLNDGAGVAIEAWGEAEAIAGFLERLRAEAPPLSRIDGIETEPLSGVAPVGGFRIAVSGHGPVATGVVPDAATCPACRSEIADPADRRYRYPFTNCTHCGPRLSIVREIPYDRATTSMSVFEMCPDCRAEYENPADRRFHAQPNACPVCGPKAWLEDRSGPRTSEDPIAETAALLSDGAIVAVKGIGGFHLACDATDDGAVDELRRRKHRADKPLALMAADLTIARKYAEIGAEEAALMECAAAPIVLVPSAGRPLARGIAPGQDHVGFMLPYTPLHHLLMQNLDRPIVLTSGNLSDEPQVIANDEARERLADIADFWLMHDREIVNRLDDSVMRCDRPGPSILRRARGLAPAPLPLAEGFADAPKILAMGGELKSTFCLLSGGQAILSQHIGDLEEAGTHADYRKNLALYRHMFDFDPEVIAVDRHPDYLSTQWGEALAEETGSTIVAVQHHHAHLAA
ncbi:MAG: carbamoyltransferase HypF, partial [Hyphomicrobiales bacterium]|nr:carbamoyltransferase HypF [Hyphomicrobiales bacterium]